MANQDKSVEEKRKQALAKVRDRRGKQRIAAAEGRQQGQGDTAQVLFRQLRHRALENDGLNTQEYDEAETDLNEESFDTDLNLSEFSSGEEDILEAGASTIPSLKKVKRILKASEDTFLRELLNTASASLKAVVALNSTQEPESDGEQPSQSCASRAGFSPEIHIRTNTEARTLSVSDNGQGMSAPEIEAYVMKQIAPLTEGETEQPEKVSPEFTGGTGLGFLTACLVADQIDIDSLSMESEAEAVCWSYAEETGLKLRPSSRQTPGTTITLRLRPDKLQYLEDSQLQQLVSACCCNITAPIFLNDDLLHEGRTSEIPKKIHRAAQRLETQEQKVRDAVQRFRDVRAAKRAQLEAPEDEETLLPPQLARGERQQLIRDLISVDLLENTHHWLSGAPSEPDLSATPIEEIKALQKQVQYRHKVLSILLKETENELDMFDSYIRMVNHANALEQAASSSVEK